LTTVLQFLFGAGSSDTSQFSSADDVAAGGNDDLASHTSPDSIPLFEWFQSHVRQATVQPSHSSTSRPPGGVQPPRSLSDDLSGQQRSKLQRDETTPVGGDTKGGDRSFCSSVECSSPDSPDSGQHDIWNDAYDRHQQSRQQRAHQEFEDNRIDDEQTGKTNDRDGEFGDGKSGGTHEDGRRGRNDAESDADDSGRQRCFEDRKTFGSHVDHNDDTVSEGEGGGTDQEQADEEPDVHGNDEITDDEILEDVDDENNEDKDDQWAANDEEGDDDDKHDDGDDDNNDDDDDEGKSGKRRSSIPEDEEQDDKEEMEDDEDEEDEEKGDKKKKRKLKRKRKRRKVFRKKPTRTTKNESQETADDSSNKTCDITNIQRQTLQECTECNEPSLCHEEATGSNLDLSTQSVRDVFTEAETYNSIHLSTSSVTAEIDGCVSNHES
jgi:hypothetical protein